MLKILPVKKVNGYKRLIEERIKGNFARNIFMTILIIIWLGTYILGGIVFICGKPQICDWLKIKPHTDGYNNFEVIASLLWLVSGFWGFYKNMPALEEERNRMEERKNRKA
jgi:hypothetical protein